MDRFNGYTCPLIDGDLAEQRSIYDRSEELALIAEREEWERDHAAITQYENWLAQRKAETQVK